MESAPAKRGDLRDYVRILRRRGWFVAAAVLLVAGAALAFELRKSERYEASAVVLLSAVDTALPQDLGDTPATQVESTRLVQAQLALARVPLVAERVVRASGLPYTAARFLAASTVTSHDESDTLSFAVRNRNAAHARQLADEYARQFVVYQEEVRSALGRERGKIRHRLAELEGRGEWSTPLHTALAEQSDRLQSYAQLYTITATFDRPAAHAAKLQPLPFRAALIGLALGLFLGVGLALLWDALEVRLRTTEPKDTPEHARGAA